jgi:alginate production protein
MNKNKLIGAGIALGFGLSSVPLWAVQYVPEKSFGLEVKVSGQSEDDRDLGTRSGGDVQGIGIDVRPWVFGQRGDWAAFAQAQAVAATDTIETDPIDDSDLGTNNDRREADKNYLAMREFWINYSGLTAYPGEFLRFGRQRLRSDDGMWMDTNIEALRWSLDTTLLRTNVGVAQRFSDYRTDLDDLRPEDQDRLHVFGDVAYQWHPGHWLGANLHHADDSGHLRRVGQTVDPLDKTFTGQLTWIGLRADGDFFNRRSEQPLNYWGQVMYLTGDRDSLQSEVIGNQRIATRRDSQNVSAWALDLGLRWKIDPNWSIGGAYAYGSGGGDEQFVQTGLESNRSNFTGTRSRLHRFGEAFRGELSNLHSAALFGSWNLNEDYDASLVYHRFWRVKADQSTGDRGLTAALVNDDKDLGQELDLVVTRYFRQGLVPEGWGWEEPSTLVRFRGGVFKPGDAYGSQADSYMHRAFVDVVWRF